MVFSEARRWRASNALRAGGGPLPATGGGCLELARLARLHVMPASTEILQDPGLQQILLEHLERPVEAVVLIQLDFDHWDSSERGAVVRFCGRAGEANSRVD